MEVNNIISSEVGKKGNLPQCKYNLKERRKTALEELFEGDDILTVTDA